MNLTKNLIYIPTYNDSKNVHQVLAKLSFIRFDFDILILDDCSSDNNIAIIQNFFNNSVKKYNYILLKCKKNYGLAGSQKLAFEFFLSNTTCENLIILHGDGQYDPIQVNLFKPFFETDYKIVQGKRSKKIFGKKEQTPLVAYITIKLLNIYENLICGTNFDEWHSGFVYYKRSFIEKLPIFNLISSPHIDGNILYIAKLLKEKVVSVNIYKTYKGEHNYNKIYILKYFFSIFYLPFYFILKNKKFFNITKNTSLKTIVVEKTNS